jgi:hypothetical protein
MPRYRLSVGTGKIVAGQPMNRSLFTMEGIPRGIEKYLLGWHRDEDASIRNPTRVEVRAEPKYGPEVLLLTLVNEGGERQMPFVCFGEEQVVEKLAELRVLFPNLRFEVVNGPRFVKVRLDKKRTKFIQVVEQDEKQVSGCEVSRTGQRRNDAVLTFATDRIMAEMVLGKTGGLTEKKAAPPEAKVA